MTTPPYDDGGGEPLAAPPGEQAAFGPPGFGPAGQMPTFQGQPIAAPKVAGQKGLFILMGFFALVAVVAGVGFFASFDKERTSVTGTMRDGVRLDLPSEPPLATLSTAGPVPKPVTYRGRGNDVVRIRKPEPGPGIAEVRGAAAPDGMFAVYALNAQGQKIGLVATSFGRYAGSRLFDTTPFLQTASFEVEAAGPWTITLRSARSAKTFEQDVTGSGDTVLRYVGQAGTATVKGGAAGQPFIVMTHENGFPKLLVTSVGAFDGRKPWPGGPVLVEVQAKGRWSIAVR